MPYYVDVGTGQSQLTWQVNAGLGYQFDWGSVLATWRWAPGNRVIDADSSRLESLSPRLPPRGSPVSTRLLPWAPGHPLSSLSSSSLGPTLRRRPQRIILMAWR